MNGNHGIKDGEFIRYQKKSITFLSQIIRTKGYFIKWSNFIKDNHKNLDIRLLKNLSAIDKENYPNDFSDIIFKENNPYYLIIYLIFWSVSGEMIDICDFKSGYFYATQNNTDNEYSEYSNSDIFFESMFSQRIELIEFAFHSGYKWQYITKRFNWLKDHLKNGGKIHIVINTPKAANIIAQHAHDDEKVYVKFKECVEQWKKFEAEHQDSVKLTVSNIPLMHSYAHFKAYKPEHSKMMINFYTHDNPNLDENYHLYLDNSSPHYNLFQKEFNYLFIQDQNK